jgi:transcriptional regulator with XRE-family HTH domain
MTSNLPFLLRVSHNYSVKDVAKKLGISESQYIEIEAGQSKLTTEQAVVLSELYHIEANYFLSNDLPMVNINAGSNNRMVINLFATHYYEDSSSESPKDERDNAK